MINIYDRNMVHDNDINNVAGYSLRNDIRSF